LVEKGAKEVYACCTHPVLSGRALEVILESPIEEMIVTDTIPLRKEAKACPKIRVLSISNLLAEAIRRIYENESVSCLFV
jgi:ribose-phosphate pyrophosphokinase